MHNDEFNMLNKFYIDYPFTQLYFKCKLLHFLNHTQERKSNLHADICKNTS